MGMNVNRRSGGGGPSGKAVIYETPDLYKVIFEDDEQGQIELPKEGALGDFVPKIVTEEECYVWMPSTEDQIWGQKPWDGNFLVRFDGLVKEGENKDIYKLEFREEKFIRNKPPKKGGWTLPAADEFTVIFRIVGKTPWNGMTVTKKYEYVFVPQPGTNLTDIDGRTNPVDEVVDLLSIIGEVDFDTFAVEWGDTNTVLGQIEALLKKGNGLGLLEISGSWPRDVTEPETVVVAGEQFNYEGEIYQ